MAKADSDSRLILLATQEALLRARSLEELTGPARREQFDYEEFVASDTPSSQWMASAQTSPFLSEIRVVVVRHILRINKVADYVGGLTDQLKTLPESSRLVLVADEEPGDDSRQTKFDAIRQEWVLLTKKIGGHVIDENIDEQQYRREIKEELDRRGLKASDRAVTMLLEMVGGSLSRAMEELDKLEMISSGNAMISEDDVQRIVIPTREWRVFALVDAALEGKENEALSQLRNLVGSQNKAEDAAFSRVLPTLSRQLRIIWQIRVVLDHGGSLSHIPAAAKKVLLGSPDIASEQEWKLRRPLSIAKRSSLEQIGNAICAVADADAAIKGILPGYSTLDTLERMVLSISESRSR